MGKVFIEESNLTAIGDAIREKTGKTDLLNPTAMPEEIKNIETGSSEPKTMMVKPVLITGLRPQNVDGLTRVGEVYYGLSSSTTYLNYWSRTDNTNIYWRVATYPTSYLKTGHQYRLSFWIWHNAAVDDTPIKIWQDRFFVNNNTMTTMPITEIRKEPQIVSVTVTYQPDSVYGFSIYMYPEASENQVRMTPIIIEDLTDNPAGEYIPL